MPPLDFEDHDFEGQDGFRQSYIKEMYHEFFLLLIVMLSKRLKEFLLRYKGLSTFLFIQLIKLYIGFGGQQFSI